MLARHDDPIVAAATAPGRAAVGIVRASGHDLGPLIAAVCARPLAPRHATLLPLRDADGQAIDQGLAIHFPAPQSYTGEDVLELQVHGGAVVLQLLLARCLAAQPGLRLAQPGEFTERAFLNGKLDLAQAEAVADLIDARTEAAARSASRSLAGAFSSEIGGLAQGLRDLRMLVEATLDFPEEDIDFLKQADARGRLARLSQRLEAVHARARQGALLREGIRIVLAGQPNVGKSSLLNALAGAELAIVTAIPGTTRDRVSETIQIEGVPVQVIDTAGLRAPEEANDEVERLGMQRSWQAIGEADVILLLHDLTLLGEPDYDRGDALIEADLSTRGADPGRVLHVANKHDARPDRTKVPPGMLPISARTGEGLAALRQHLLRQAGGSADALGGEGVYMARARHLDALRRAREHLGRAADEAARADAALELLAEELRLAHDALGEITGACTSDDLLGDIFGRFCIGK